MRYAFALTPHLIRSKLFLSFYVTIFPPTCKQEYQTFSTAVIEFGTYTYIYTQPTNIKNWKTWIDNELVVLLLLCDIASCARLSNMEMIVLLESNVLSHFHFLFFFQGLQIYLGHRGEHFQFILIAKWSVFRMHRNTCKCFWHKKSQKEQD